MPLDESALMCPGCPAWARGWKSRVLQACSLVTLVSAAWIALGVDAAMSVALAWSVGFVGLVVGYRAGVSDERVAWVALRARSIVPMQNDAFARTVRDSAARSMRQSETLRNLARERSREFMVPAVALSATPTTLAQEEVLRSMRPGDTLSIEVAPSRSCPGALVDITTGPAAPKWDGVPADEKRGVDAEAIDAAENDRRHRT